MPKKGQALTSALILVVAVAAPTMGLLLAVAFAAAALTFVAFNVVPLRSIYTAVNWPVILLLGATMASMSMLF